MRTENETGIDFHRSTKDIAYTREFRDLIRKDPKVIAHFKNLLDRLNNIPLQELQREMGSETFAEDSITARLINTYQWDEESSRVYYFQLTIGEEQFFVKSEGVPWRGKGYDEYINTNEVKKRLKEMPWADTVEFMLGYQDKKGKTLYVSKWQNLPILREYMSGLDSEDDQSELRELDQKVRQLQSLLPEFHDLTKQNMFYDARSKKIILFDLFTESQDLHRR